MGGKFRDLWVNHENNEKWHPTKITHPTVISKIYSLALEVIMLGHHGDEREDLVLSHMTVWQAFKRSTGSPSTH